MTKLKALLVSLLMALGLAAVPTPAQAQYVQRYAKLVTSAAELAYADTAGKMPTLSHMTLKGKMAPHGQPGGIHPFTCPCYDYAGNRQTVASDGFGISLMSVESPAGVSSGTQHSLMELSVTDNLGNTVEWGWIKDTIVCGLASSPCLFAGHWINGVFQGYNTGFTPAVGCSPCAGASISGAIGTTKQFGIQYITNANPALNAWWMSYNGAYVGAYLASRWTTPTFTRGAFNQAFGEVVDSTASSCIDMGNGVLATVGGLGSKINSYAAVNPTGAGTLTAFASQPTKWNGVMVTGVSARASGPGWC